jgi:cell division protein FtsB
MPRSPARKAPTADAQPEAAERPDPGGSPTNGPAGAAAVASLSDLPVAGLTRRRIGFLIGALVAAWMLVLFARQVIEASDAASRAEAMRASNGALEADVEALERELDLIQRQTYVQQQAREFRLGRPTEVPFILDDAAPPLGVDAPGSAAARLGAAAEPASPLESWLDLLFGSDEDQAGRVAGS